MPAPEPRPDVAGHVKGSAPATRLHALTVDGVELPVPHAIFGWLLSTIGGKKPVTSKLPAVGSGGAPVALIWKCWMSVRMESSEFIGNRKAMAELL